MTLKVTGLTRHFPGNEWPTLEGLSCELPQGRLTAVVGRSGTGKSTLLRCVVGLEPFERGEVQVEDVVVRGTAESGAPERAQAMARARAKLGFVFQSFELFPHLTAVENCSLALVQVKGEGREAARARAKKLLEQLGLGDKLTAWPEQLSGGQQQRVAIARALAMEPRVLLYDEPTSALDPSMKHEVLQTLKQVQAEGVTQVVVTHQLAVARGADYLCVIDHGRIVEVGAPGEVLERPQHESTKALLAAWSAGGE